MPSQTEKLEQPVEDFNPLTTSSSGHSGGPAVGTAEREEVVPVHRMHRPAGGLRITGPCVRAAAAPGVS